MVCPNFSRKPQYVLLPPSGNAPPLSFHGMPSKRWMVIVSVLLATMLGASWGIVRLLTKKPYSPLLRYQHLGAPPLLNETKWHSSPLPSSSLLFQKRAVVSSLYSDSFVIGVAVLGHSIRAANTSARLLLPYLPSRISPTALCIAREVGWEPVAVPLIPPPHGGMGVYHRFRDQYTKLNVWGLDRLGIEKAVYLDADTLVRRNFDELFDLPFAFAAVPDVYTDARAFGIGFNAGVLVFEPSTAVLENMKVKIETAEFPLEQAEQSFLNLFFGPSAVRLPYAYNANLAIKYKSRAMWEGMKADMRIVHYTLTKPFVDDLLDGRILSDETQRKIIDEAAQKREGLFREEIGWWKTAYEQMMRDVPSIKSCRR